MTPLASGRTADVFALDSSRVLRRYRDGLDASTEVAVMQAVRALGFPVPQVFSASGPDIVMERLHGPTMLAAMTDLDDSAHLLASLHKRLAATGYVHLDLHPDNVILTADGPVVIDWCNATLGDPDLDVAMTSVVLAQASLSTHPAAEAFLAAFLKWVNPLPQLPSALTRRAADPAMSAAETALLPLAEELIHRLYPI